MVCVEGLTDLSIPGAHRPVCVPCRSAQAKAGLEGLLSAWLLLLFVCLLLLHTPSQAFLLPAGAGFISSSRRCWTTRRQALSFTSRYGTAVPEQRWLGSFVTLLGMGEEGPAEEEEQEGMGLSGWSVQWFHDLMLACKQQGDDTGDYMLHKVFVAMRAAGHETDRLSWDLVLEPVKQSIPSRSSLESVLDEAVETGDWRAALYALYKMNPRALTQVGPSLT